MSVRKSSRELKPTEKFKEFLEKTPSRQAEKTALKPKIKPVVKTPTNVPKIKNRFFPETFVAVKQPTPKLINTKFPKVVLNPIDVSNYVSFKTIKTVKVVDSGKSEVIVKYKDNEVTDKDDKVADKDDRIMDKHDKVAEKLDADKSPRMVKEEIKCIKKALPKYSSLSPENKENELCLKEESFTDTDETDSESDYRKKPKYDEFDTPGGRRSRRPIKPKKYCDFVSIANRDVARENEESCIRESIPMPKKGKFSSRNFMDDDASSSGHEMDFYEASDSDEGHHRTPFTTSSSGDKKLSSSLEIDRLKKDWDDDEDEEHDDPKDSDFSFENLFRPKPTLSKKVVVEKKPESLPVFKIASEVKVEKRPRGRPRKNPLPPEKLGYLDVMEDLDSVKPFLKRMIKLGMDMSDVLTKSIRTHNVPTRFFITPLEKRFRIFLSSLSISNDADLSDEDAQKIVQWLDDEQKERQQQRDLILEGIRTSHDSNMGLMTQVLDVLEAI